MRNRASLLGRWWVLALGLSLGGTSALAQDPNAANPSAANPSATDPSVTGAPLSPMGWLNDIAREAEAQARTPPEPPATAAPAPTAVEVQTLAGTDPRAYGLLPWQTTGLPDGLWQGSSTSELTALWSRTSAPLARPYAMARFGMTLMLAEARPPTTGKTSDWLRARARWLMRAGAVPQARALLEQAPTATDPATAKTLFADWFGAALLDGAGTQVCQHWRAAPWLSEDLRLHVFCWARLNDWATAMTVLNAADGLGDLSADQSGLLLRFLDPALAEDLPALPAPRDPDPLTYRIYEAIGEPQSITRLPLAFAATQLDGDGGWKAQIDATERLTRAGSLPPARLLEVYGARRPAASGGVWDRVAAVQALRRALAGDDIAAQVTASARAFEILRPAGLAVVLARGMATDLPGLTSLAGVDLGGAASDVATLAHMHLLSDDYELAARALPPDLGAHLPNHALLVAIAQGQSAQPLGGNRHATAIATAFAMRPALPEVDALVADMRLGEAIVIAMAQVNAGAMGDGRALTQGLRSLRSLGLEDLARRTALELLILDPLQ